MSFLNQFSEEELSELFALLEDPGAGFVNIANIIIAGCPAHTVEFNSASEADAALVEFRKKAQKIMDVWQLACVNVLRANPDITDSELCLYVGSAKRIGEKIVAYEGVREELTKSAIRRVSGYRVQAKGQEPKTNKKKKNASQTLLEIAEKNPDAKAWSGGDWAKNTGMPRSTITSCKAFRSVDFGNARTIRKAWEDQARRE